MSQQAAVEAFRKKYGQDPEVIAIAPGRINLIGEHTDYNDGFVFPAAIDKRVYVAARRTQEEASNLHSLETGDSKPFDARTAKPGDLDDWGGYAAGMAWVLREGRQPMPNVQAIVSGDVPIGSGVSSSAALELAFGAMWRQLCYLEISNKDLALLGQKSENHFVGVRTGIMDQMASAMGKEGKAMFLDTRSLEIRYASVPAELSVVVLDTKKPRALADSAYNERRSQCEEASRILGVKALRDADMAALEAKKGQMDPVVYRRARHVITEDARCEQFAVALDSSDLQKIGELMKDSHESLRDDYEVSSKELDLMAEAAWSAEGCVGARMTGAGFGGACVALVENSALPRFIEQVSRQYQETSGLAGEIMPCKLSDGAHAVTGAHTSG